MPAERSGAVAGVVLAAGSSTRMGRNKLYFELDGESLLRRVVRRALDAGLDPVLVVVGHDVPAGHGVPSALVPALVTVVVVAGATLGGGPRLRAWAPVAGIVLGSVAAAGFGTYDTARVAQAAWIGFPDPQWPGLDLEFGSPFWGLLPAFLLVYVVTAILSISAILAVQAVAWRQQRAVDFRAVEGGVFADAISNLMAALGARSPMAPVPRRRR